MLDPPLDTMTQAEEEHALTHPVGSSNEHRVVGRPWPKGVSGNPSGRPKRHHLDTLLEAELEDGETVTKLVELARSGDLNAIKYAHDRVAGLPVQRHEDRLMVEVDETAKNLAEAYDLPIDEVRARAKRIAQGT
jgi:hypothetical protein